MKEKNNVDIIFAVYILVISALAIVYFTMPERAVLLTNAIDWWSELLDIIL